MKKEKKEKDTSGFRLYNVRLIRPLTVGYSICSIYLKDSSKLVLDTRCVTIYCGYLAFFHPLLSFIYYSLGGSCEFFNCG